MKIDYKKFFANKDIDLPDQYKQYIQDDGTMQFAAKASLENNKNGGHSAIITVEIPDHDGDIVRVDGMSLASHTNESPIKILPMHTRGMTANGDPLVLGRALKFEQLTLAGRKAIRMDFEFFKDSNGEYLSPLIETWAKYVENRAITNVSVGFFIKDFDLIRNKEKVVTGLDIKKSHLIEVSLVDQGANPGALIEKEIKTDDKIDKISHLIESLSQKIESLHTQNDVLENRLDEITTRLAGKKSNVLEEQLKKYLDSRKK